MFEGVWGPDVPADAFPARSLVDRQRDHAEHGQVRRLFRLELANLECGAAKHAVALALFFPGHDRQCVLHRGLKLGESHGVGLRR
jgi:hypothetical protein